MGTIPVVITHEWHMAALMGYLLGSIPFGLLLTKFFGAGDLRAIGSGNIGATNVLRTGRKGLAIATLLLDGGKGTVAVVLAGLWFGGVDAAIVAGLMVVIGHNFPMWLRFKGGKGVATTIGVFFGLSWMAGIAVCAVWLLVAFITRYSSLAALVSFAASPFILFYFTDEHNTVLAVLLTVLAFVRHLENIQRLRIGEESKIGQKKSD